MDKVYVAPVPTTLNDLQKLITIDVNSTTPDMLQRVWSELDSLIDVCRIRVGRIEFLIPTDVTLKLNFMY